MVSLVASIWFQKRHQLVLFSQNIDWFQSANVFIRGLPPASTSRQRTEATFCGLGHLRALWLARGAQTRHTELSAADHKNDKPLFWRVNSPRCPPLLLTNMTLTRKKTPTDTPNIINPLLLTHSRSYFMMKWWNCFGVPSFLHISFSPLTQIHRFRGTTVLLCGIGKNKHRNDTITKYSYPFTTIHDQNDKEAAERC